MIRLCKYCGNQFESKHKHVVFCSHSCANKASAKVRMRRVKIKCEYCGKEFEVTRGELRYRKVIRFCSNECYHKAIKTKNIKCKYCGKEFKPQRKTNKFCSIDCHNKYRKDKKRAPEAIEKVKKGMAKPEVKKRLSILNSRKRAPMKEAHKMKISDRLAGKMPKNINTHIYGNVKSGKYDINGKVIFFRSTWEANYALYLDFLIKQKEIKKWEYETDRFMFEKIKLGTRSYRPDFKIFNNNGSTEYHEVKGYMDDRSKTKLKRMAKYYPEIKIRLIDKPVYNSIKKWAKMLKFY